MDIFRNGIEGVDWIDLNQYRNKRQSVLSTVQNFQMP
jgi:hypothetical protein